MKRTLLWTLLASPLWAQPGLHFERIESNRPDPPANQARTSPLPVNQIEQLLARLPALPPAQVKAFVFPASRSLPPEAGRRLQEPFPAANPVSTPRPAAADVPLQILSYAPRGGVQTASEIHITFNRPSNPPPAARLTPPIPGHWQWMGAQELVFRPETRLPMATEFQVSLPGLHWSFATAAPQLTYHYPGDGSSGLQPVIYLEFNQKIDPRRVLEFVTLDGYPLRPASAQEVAADPLVQARIKTIEPDRWLAVVPVDPLRPGSLCTVRLLKGLPSAEGPLTTDKTQSFPFHTSPPQTNKTSRVVVLRPGTVQPTFQHPRHNFVLLHPSDPPELNFRLTGYKKLKVQVSAADPKHWEEYRGWQSSPKQKTPGQLLYEKEIAGELIALNLAEEFKKSPLLLVQATPLGSEAETYQCWIQRSPLGLNVASDDTQMRAWVTRLTDGSPVAGARVGRPNESQPAQTDAQGLVRLPRSGPEEAVLVQDGENQLLFPLDTYYPAKRPSDDLRWFIQDDRKLYKPGETVSIKGWLRLEAHQPQSRLVLPPQSQIRYTLLDAHHQKLAQGEAASGHLGSFQFQIPLPKTVENLGRAELEIQAGPYSTRHQFQIQEYRAPEFEASTQAEQPGAVLGGSGSFCVQASYFAGGALKNSPVLWEVVAQIGKFSPPHWPGYQFGDSRNWWYSPDQQQPIHRKFETSTDANGKDKLDLRFLAADSPQPYVVQAEATVRDANQHPWSSADTMLVHPAPHYVGLKAGRAFVEAGQALELQLIATDLEGRPSASIPIELKVQQLDSDEKTREISKQQLTSTLVPLNLSLPFQEAGLYEIQATLRDQNNQSNQSSLLVWVAGPRTLTDGEPKTRKLTLIPDKKTYHPGETARVLVQAPFQRGNLLITQARSGLASQQTCPFEGGQAVLSLPLTENHLPNLHLNVQAVGQTGQADGDVDLEISLQSRELQVEVQPSQETLLPGATTQLEIRLKDDRNQPVANSDVALLAVDESVLALSDVSETSLLKAFYPTHYGEVQQNASRSYLQLPLPPPPTLQDAVPGLSIGTPLAGGAPSHAGPFEIIGNRLTGIGAFQGAQALSAWPLDIGTFQSASPGAVNITSSEAYRAAVAPTPTPEKPIQLRSDFTPLACFLPSLRSDSNGRLQASFKLPDNLTRYRLIALAAAGADHFGEGQASLTARQPLMLRPSPPRFLNLGDQARLPVLVQNQSDHPQRVQLACRASNLKIDSPGLQFEVPANDRVEVSFPIATEEPGQAQIQLALSSAEFADAATSEIPVLTPASSENYATYGTLEEGTVTQPVLAPGEADPNYGGLEVSTSSTALSELSDAFLYLREYPHECTEQLSSRVLSTVALEPVLRAFQTSRLPTPMALKQSLQSDLKKLQRLQNDDGGWDYWERGRPSAPFPSLHVTHALLRLRQAKYAVDEHLLEKALQYTANLPLRKDTPQESALALRSYALYVLNRAGRPTRAKARQILQQRGLEQTPLECLGWLLPSLAGQPEEAAILRHLANRVSQTASSAEFVTQYEDGAPLILASRHRDDAILLEALLSHDGELAPKLVRGLLDGRRGGRWESTQENCWVLLALQAYFQKHESTRPDFLARLWLGEAYAGEQAFRGYSADSHELRVPLPQLQGDLTLSKQGPGRLYYRVGLKSTPLSHQLPALERGFRVSRTYQATGDNDEVRREPGQWRIKAGSRVKVTVTMTAPASRYQVALVDPLPAGLEVINPALKGGQQSRDGQACWYEHENLRDDRVEAFSYRLSAGSYEYSYYARALTPGQFTAPPARAEEMYHPETFGRCATDRVIITP